MRRQSLSHLSGRWPTPAEQQPGHFSYRHMPLVEQDRQTVQASKPDIQSRYPQPHGAADTLADVLAGVSGCGRHEAYRSAQPSDQEEGGVFPTAEPVSKSALPPPRQHPCRPLVLELHYSFAITRHWTASWKMLSIGDIHWLHECVRVRLACTASSQTRPWTWQPSQESSAKLCDHPGLLVCVHTGMLLR